MSLYKRRYLGMRVLSEKREVAEVLEELEEQ